MDKSGASAYVFAKASGMLARSFVGTRSAQLFEQKSLADLWSLVFNTEVPPLPEVLLAQELEHKAEKQFIEDYTMLLDCYSKPEPVAETLLRAYDYSNLKDISHALSDGKTELPHIADIGIHSQLHVDSWPDIAAITEGTPFSWYNKIPERSEQKDTDHRLDVQYTMALWHALDKVPVNERGPVRELIQYEIQMTNCLWALRLRVYYDMSNEDIIRNMVTLSDTPDENDQLAGEAIKMLSYPLDDYDSWKKWQFFDCLNPKDPADFWKADPRWVDRAARANLQKMAMKRFHRYPFTAYVLAAWFKIKQHELYCIRMASEGLRLAVDEEQLKEFAGIER